ncbi:uncharacterized protein LOC110598732 isoform X2 [Ictidomys tridecemlineatus]
MSAPLLSPHLVCITPQILIILLPSKHHQASQECYFCSVLGWRGMEEDFCLTCVFRESFNWLGGLGCSPSGVSLPHGAQLRAASLQEMIDYILFTAHRKMKQVEVLLMEQNKALSRTSPACALRILGRLLN